MSDKYLTEREWKNFSKNPAYKAEPLTKALAALEKSEKAAPEATLKALDDVEKQADILQKANKADKVLAAYLAELGKSAAKARKEAEQAHAAAKEEAEDEPDEALLDAKKLLVQLNLCKRDPDRTVQFAFVDAKDKQPASLAMSPKMSGRKMFARLQTALGVKTGAFGSAWVDGTVLMLQLDKPLSGLVKKVRAPVKECGFRITKAVLWNADGTVFEQDEETDSPQDAPADATAQSRPVEATRGHDAAQAFKERLAALIPRMKDVAPESAQELKLKVSEAGVFARKLDFEKADALLDDAERLLGASSKPSTADPSVAFNARLATMVPRMAAAKAAGHPGVAEIRQKIADAGTLARDKEYVAANSLLDTVEPMFDVKPQATGTSNGAGAAPAGATPAQAQAALRAALKVWREASDIVDAQIAALQRELKKSDDVELVEISEFGMNGITGNFKARLMASMVELQTGEGPALRTAAQKALPLAAGLRQHLASEAKVTACDENPFGVTVTIRQTLGGALAELSGALQLGAA